MLDTKATSPQTAPTGNGAVVMDFVEQRINELIELYTPTGKWKNSDVMKPDYLRVLLADLQERKEAGTKKYGTPLRIHNGRKAAVDLYQEVADAIMYAAQARMEGDTAAGNYLELFINIGQQLAAKIRKDDANNQA